MELRHCIRHHVNGRPRKHRFRLLNRVPSLSADLNMSTSGLAAAILNFPLTVWSYDIVLGTMVTGDPKNIGFAVETAFLAGLQA